MTTNQNKENVSEKFSNVFFDAFDTLITITAYCGSQAEFDEIFNYCRDEFLRYHKLYDIYNSYDGVVNLRDINDKAAQAPIEADKEILELLSFAKDAYEKTDGRVNAAMGSVLRLWHNAREAAAEIGSEKARVPAAEDLKAAAEHCSIEDLIIDESNGTVFFNDSMLKLDVGAVAKGYATEKIAEALEEKGCSHVLINAGGNVRTIGAKPDDSDWVIGIQSPDANSGEAYAEKLKVSALSVVTSGVYERNFSVDGVKYHHIIDPDTLFPENRFQSVSIVTKSSALADALSTGVFNMDLEKGRFFINSLDGVEAMWILNDGTKVYSDGFAGYVYP